MQPKIKPVSMGTKEHTRRFLKLRAMARHEAVTEDIGQHKNKICFTYRPLKTSSYIAVVEAWFHKDCIRCPAELLFSKFKAMQQEGPSQAERSRGRNLKGETVVYRESEIEVLQSTTSLIQASSLITK